MFKFHRKITSLLIGLSLGGLILSACGVAAAPVASTPTPLPPPPAATPPDNGLTGTNWQLTAINGVAVPSSSENNKPITLNFGADGQASGSGGCNSFGGGYQVQGDSLTFGPIVSTKMACLDGTAMQQEGQYFQILQAATKFSLAPEQLTITGQGADTLVFVSASIP